MVQHPKSSLIPVARETLGVPGRHLHHERADIVVNGRGTASTDVALMPDQVFVKEEPSHGPQPHLVLGKVVEEQLVVHAGDLHLSNGGGCVHAGMRDKLYQCTSAFCGQHVTEGIDFHPRVNLGSRLLRHWLLEAGSGCQIVVQVHVAGDGGAVVQAEVGLIRCHLVFFGLASEIFFKEHFKNLKVYDSL